MEFDTYKKIRINSRYNKKFLQEDKMCGCFYCLKIFPPKEIIEWCAEEPNGDGVTALCPYCGVDSVISESSGYLITVNLLKSMNHYAFNIPNKHTLR